MALDQNIGMVTAYAYARSKGYTGTEDEFAEALANADVTLDQITDAVDEFIDTTVPAKVAEVTAEGTRQIGLVQSEGTAQVSAVNSAGSAQIGLVQSEGTTQKNAVIAQGQATIASIPSDYTALSNEVVGLKNTTVQKINMELCDTESVPKSANLWNPAIATAGGYSANGTYQNRSDYVNETIEVTAGDTLYFYTPNALSNYRWICALDSNSSVVYSSGSNTGAQSFTVPNGIAALKVSVATAVSGTIMILVGVTETPTSYIPFYEEHINYLASNEFAKNINDIPPLWFTAELPSQRAQFVRYSDGAFVNSGATHTFVMRNNSYSRVKVHSQLGSFSVAAIAFYSTETPDASSYIASASVACDETNVGKWYIANVPASAKSIAVCSDNVDTTAHPILLPVNDLIEVVNAEKIRQDNLLAYSTPFSFGKFYSHMFANHVTGGFAYTGGIIIPAESVFSVDIDKRLGFKFTEANVHATATQGKYVVTHGKSGKLGDDFETLSGEEATNVTIASTSFDDLRNNYVYRSQFSKYKVPITSLEEFCYACRANDIYPVLQYLDETSLDIARAILGDNIILYKGNREVFDGFIIEYLSLTTESEILEQCESVGRPYIYCMANTTSFTDMELESIVGTLHKKGYYIAMAGNYAGLPEAVRCSNLGFDFISSDSMVNDFENGNLIDFHDTVSFDNLTTTGEVSNGVLALNIDDTISISSDDASFLKKFVLNIRFDGRIKIRFPSAYEYMSNADSTLESDGAHNMLIGGTAVNKVSLSVTITALEQTAVYEIGFKASKC